MIVNKIFERGECKFIISQWSANANDETFQLRIEFFHHSYSYFYTTRCLLNSMIHFCVKFIQFWLIFWISLQNRRMKLKKEIQAIKELNEQEKQAQAAKMGGGHHDQNGPWKQTYQPPPPPILY